jgi:hypothetical protein
MTNVFDRLYHSETAASHSLKTREPALINADEESHELEHIKTSTEVKELVPKKQKRGSIRAVPNKQSKTQLMWSCKYNSHHGFLPLSATTLGLDHILHRYEERLISPEECAHHIITALFNRDFNGKAGMGPGKHWDVDGSLVSLTQDEDCDGGITFHAKKEATWDWKDIYSVATAKATIRFLPFLQEIRVEYYSYYVAG